MPAHRLKRVKMTEILRSEIISRKIWFLLKSLIPLILTSHVLLSSSLCHIQISLVFYYLFASWIMFIASVVESLSSLLLCSVVM